MVSNFKLSRIKLAARTLPPPSGTSFGMMSSMALPINTNIWTFENGNNNGWGNQELEYYTDSTNNAYVDGNGLLHIVVLQQSTNGFDYTSARMLTQGLRSWAYGRMEASIKLPRGQGIWPAFWMLGTNIDPSAGPPVARLTSWRTSAIPTTRDEHGTIHGPATGGITIVARELVEPIPCRAARLSPTPSIFTPCSGRPTKSNGSWTQICFSRPLPPVWLPSGGTWVFTQPAIPHTQCRRRRQLARQPGCTTVFPQQMLVDYVRVYQQTAPLQITGDPVQWKWF